MHYSGSPYFELQNRVIQVNSQAFVYDRLYNRFIVYTRHASPLLLLYDADDYSLLASYETHNFSGSAQLEICEISEKLFITVSGISSPDNSLIEVRELDDLSAYSTLDFASYSTTGSVVDIKSISCSDGYLYASGNSWTSQRNLKISTTDYSVEILPAPQTQMMYLRVVNNMIFSIERGSGNNHHLRVRDAATMVLIRQYDIAVAANAASSIVFGHYVLFYRDNGNIAAIINANTRELRIYDIKPHIFYPVVNKNDMVFALHTSYTGSIGGIYTTKTMAVDSTTAVFLSPQPDFAGEEMLQTSPGNIVMDVSFDYSADKAYYLTRDTQTSFFSIEERNLDTHALIRTSAYTYSSGSLSKICFYKNKLYVAAIKTVYIIEVSDLSVSDVIVGATDGNLNLQFAAIKEYQEDILFTGYRNGTQGLRLFNTITRSFSNYPRSGVVDIVYVGHFLYELISHSSEFIVNIYKNGVFIKSINGGTGGSTSSALNLSVFRNRVWVSKRNGTSLLIDKGTATPFRSLNEYVHGEWNAQAEALYAFRTTVNNQIRVVKDISYTPGGITEQDHIGNAARSMTNKYIRINNASDMGIRHDKQRTYVIWFNTNNLEELANSNSIIMNISSTGYYNSDRVYLNCSGIFTLDRINSAGAQIAASRHRIHPSFQTNLNNLRNTHWHCLILCQDGISFANWYTYFNSSKAYFAFQNGSGDFSGFDTGPQAVIQLRSGYYSSFFCIDRLITDQEADQILKLRGRLPRQLRSDVLSYYKFDKKSGKTMDDLEGDSSMVLFNYTDEETASGGQPQSGNTVWCNGGTLLPVIG